MQAPRWPRRTSRAQRAPLVFAAEFEGVLQLAALVLVVALSCLAHLAGHGVLSAAVVTRLASFFDKFTLAPGVLLYAVAVLTVGYGAATWAGRSPVDRWLAPVTTIGRHSLDSYVISMCATIVIPAVHRFPASGWFAQGLAVASLLAAYAWARFRERNRSAVVGSPVTAAAADCVPAEGSLPPVLGDERPNGHPIGASNAPRSSETMGCLAPGGSGGITHATPRRAPLRTALAEGRSLVQKGHPS